MRCIQNRIHSKESSLIVLLLLAGLLSGFSVVHAEDYLSPEQIVIDTVQHRGYATAHTGRQILVFDTRKGAPITAFDLSAAPNGLVLASDGARLYVTAGVAQGRVIVLDAQTGDPVHVWPAGHTPTAPVLSQDGNVLYICNRFTDTIQVFDTHTGAVNAEIPMVREPVAAVLHNDGKRLFVANHLPHGAANAREIAAVVSCVDVEQHEVVKQITLPNGSTDLRGITLSPDGKYLYVVHILARYHLPTTQLERGWMNTNALSIVDAKTATYLNTVLLDDVDAGAANPYAVACSPDGRWLCVTHAGTHELSVIDRSALHERLAKLAQGKQATEVATAIQDAPNDLSFLAGIRHRVQLSGQGPRGLALCNGEAWVAQYFSDTLCHVQWTQAGSPALQTITFGAAKPLTQLRKGELFFNDARLCFQQWQSCASCHPDVRADALNWDLLNDGIGNPKNTKSLLLSHRTPPVMVTGVRDRAETAVRAGIRYIQFAVRPDEDAQAIDAYLKSLAPLPSPHRINGELSPEAQRGKVVFQKAGCAHCHPAPLYTNLKTYNIGTGTGQEAQRRFDTPSLREVWRTAPYLHDGRAATLHALLTEHNETDMHGKTAKLSASEIADLVAFLRSL